MKFGKANPFPMWPPIPVSGLLGCELDLDFSRKNEWGAEEWRAYALFLEVKGAEMAARLRNVERELFEAWLKASRSKPKSIQNTKQKTKGLLDIPFVIKDGVVKFSNEHGRRRGRKKNDNLMTIKYARLALEKRKKGKFKSDWIALQSVYDDEGLTRREKNRPNRAESRNILNYMSNLRNQKIA